MELNYVPPNHEAQRRREYQEHLPAKREEIEDTIIPISIISLRCFSPLTGLLSSLFRVNKRKPFQHKEETYLIN